MTSANRPQPQPPPPPPPPGAAGASIGIADAAAAVEWLAADPRPLLQVRVDGTLCWANAAGARLLQRVAAVGEQRSPLGRPLSQLLGLPDDDATQLQRTVAAGGTALLATRDAAAAGAPPLRLHADAGRLAGDVRLLALTTVAQPPGRGDADDDSHDRSAAGPSYAEVASQLGLAVQLARIAVWRHDLATDRLYFNDLAGSVLDIETAADGVPVQLLREQIHPLDLPSAKQAFEDALASGRPTDVELRHRRRDGSWRTLMTRRVVQASAAGRPAALIGVALDVSDRVDESRRAAELGRRFDLATRAGGIGYWSIDGSAGPPHWSDQLRAIHGLAPGAAAPTLADWIAVYLHADDRAAVRRRLSDWTRSGRPSLDAEFRVVRTDGEVRFLVTHSRVEGAGASSRLLFGLVIDVTGRRNVELALRQAGERAALAARGAGIGTWEVDLLDGAAFWDDQMWQLRGLTPLLQPPSAAERMALVHPDDRASVQRQIDDTDDDEAPANHEFRVLLPDGSVRWLASRSVTVRDAQGRLARRIGVNWDITDSRTADAVRQEREIALRENQAKSKFLARMSHELRTPLNAVLGFAQLLLADDAGTDAAAATRRQRVDHISAAGQHLLALIDDVLDLSALDGGEKRVQLQPVSLSAVVAGTLPLLQPLLRGRNVSVETGALDAVVLADATRLRQVLLNLLSNAIKYNRDGGRVMLAATSDERDRSVEIRIADTGRGLTPEQLRHLFEPFNRLGAERGSIEGNGIGLAIVKTLVRRMGGSVQVSSTPGAGSVFALRLGDGSPASAGAGAPLQPAPRGIAVRQAAFDGDTAPAVGDAPAQRRTLLYVEDNPVNALIISELIARRADVQLHIAVDGVSGVQSASALRPDLVLLDMQLPDIDGHEVLRRLRAQPCTAAIPVIALSANAMPDDIDRALRAGFSDYWTKPLDYRTFLGSIDALFGQAG